MTRSHAWLVGDGVALSVAVLVIATSMLQDDPAPMSKPRLVAQGTQIRISEGFALDHRIESSRVIEGELSPVIQVLGRIDYDVRRFAAVGARVAGRVLRIHKLIGADVQPGTVVADIESAEVGQAQALAETLAAKDSAAQANLVREEGLAAARVTTLREVESAAAKARALHAERRAAAKAVATMGAQASTKLGVVRLRSPIAGRLVGSHADRGQVVSPRDTLFEIADLSRVWALLAVFERDLDRIQEGDDVEILPASRERAFLRGRIAHIARTLDPDTRSAEVRVEIDNRGGRLRPGQSVRARIHVSTPTRTYTLARKAAITFVDGQPTAFALIGPGLIEPKKIDIGPEDETYVVVRQGLHAGEDIVTRGLSALKSEIYR